MAHIKHVHNECYVSFFFHFVSLVLAKGALDVWLEHSVMYKGALDVWLEHNVMYKEAVT